MIITKYNTFLEDWSIIVFISLMVLFPLITEFHGDEQGTKKALDANQRPVVLINQYKPNSIQVSQISTPQRARGSIRAGPAYSSSCNH